MPPSVKPSPPPAPWICCVPNGHATVTNGPAPTWPAATIPSLRGPHTAIAVNDHGEVTVGANARAVARAISNDPDVRTSCNPNALVFDVVAPAEYATNPLWHTAACALNALVLDAETYDSRWYPGIDDAGTHNAYAFNCHDSFRSEC